MAPKEAPTADGLTARENELALLMVKCLRSKPDVDYEKLATLGNYKGEKSARDNVNKVLKKVMTSTKAADDEGAEENGKVSPNKRKTAAGEDEDDKEENPTKKKKATPKKPKKGKKASVADGSEPEEVVKEELDEEA